MFSWLQVNEIVIHMPSKIAKHQTTYTPAYRPKNGLRKPRENGKCIQSMINGSVSRRCLFSIFSKKTSNETNLIHFQCQVTQTHTTNPSFSCCMYIQCWCFD